MKIHAIYLLSAFLSVVAAGSSTDATNILDNAEVVEYTGTHFGRPLKPRVAIPVPQGPSPPSPGRFLGCTSAKIDGSNFGIQCDGGEYIAWVDCENGYRYFTTKVRWMVNVIMTCPNGSSVVTGGAYGIENVHAENNPRPPVH